MYVLSSLCQAKINLCVWRDNCRKWEYSTLSGEREKTQLGCECVKIVWCLFGLFMSSGD